MLTYGFYNSDGGDRTYDAEQFSSLFNGIIRDGVFADIGEAFFVTPNGSSLSVFLGTGRAWFNDTWTNVDVRIPISIDGPGVLNQRIDSIVLEINKNSNARANSIKVLKGSDATPTTLPTLTNSGNVYQYRIANITVLANATYFRPADISYRGGISIANGGFPFITGILEALDSDTLLAQWDDEYHTWLNAHHAEVTDLVTGLDAQFDAWFANIVDQLSTDAAGNLQNQIDINRNAEFDVESRQGAPDSEDWNQSGTSNWGVGGGHNMIQVGNYYPTGSEGRSEVTFPTPFLHIPVVFLTVDKAPPWEVTARLLETTTTGFTCKLTRHIISGGTEYHVPESSGVATTFNWLAIGPRVVIP